MSKIYGNFKLKPPFKRLYPIYWVVPSKSEVAYGICGYRGTAFTVTSATNIIISVVTDLFITNGKCEERERCLCLDCKYNRTTIGSFAESKDTSVKRLSKKWGKLIAKVNSVVVDVDLLTSQVENERVTKLINIKNK